MAEKAHVIKRYANRKLYDTERSRYVTLDQIAEMVRSGEQIQIVDNTSKEDLTKVTLAQIIFEEEKRQRSFLPLDAMRSIIQSGGEAIQEASARLSSVFRRDRPDGEGTMGEAPDEGKAVLSALLESSQKAAGELQKRIDERVRAVIESVSPLAGVQKELAALTARIVELERRIEAIERSKREERV
jgi:polyhydroxyalkanoate synthesis repressor PhaR